MRASDGVSVCVCRYTPEPWPPVLPCLCPRPSKLVQFMEVTVSITALEIREEFLQDRKPMFEVVGPWDHVFL